MNMEKIVEDIGNLIVKELNLGKGIEIDADTEVGQIGMDSVAMMTLWVFAEEHFGFVADESAMFGSSYNTVGDIAKYIESKIEKSPVA